MPPIQNVEEAVSLANSFVGRYFGFKTLKTARKEGKDWYVEFDVGLLAVEVVKVTLEGDTGAIISYERQ